VVVFGAFVVAIIFFVSNFISHRGLAFLIMSPMTLDHCRCASFVVRGALGWST